MNSFHFSRFRHYEEINEISKNEKNSKIFYCNYIGEILSYEAPMVLIFSGIAHTLHLEQNKSPYAPLNMIKNTKHPAEKRKKNNFSPISKKNSFSKSAYSKNFAEKIEIFVKFSFNRKLLPKTRRMSTIGPSYDKISSFS